MKIQKFNSNGRHIELPKIMNPNRALEGMAVPKNGFIPNSKIAKNKQAQGFPIVQYVNYLIKKGQNIKKLMKQN